MSALIEERVARLEEHRDDMLSALVVLELLEAEDCPVATANLIQLGKRALGSKLQLLDDLLGQIKRKGGAS